MRVSRRTALGMIAATVAAPMPSRAAAPVPKIGMGTWITFDIPRQDEAARDRRVAVLRRFFEAGGQMVDSSPMYGMAEDVMGYCLKRLGDVPLTAASKVWIPTPAMGREQIEASRALWGIPRFDVMQVHNLLAYEGHIETLRAMKAAGEVREIGITTSHGRRHGDFARIMEHDDSLDTVQFTYNMVDREAEARLLPLAAERGLKVIINRPFQRGALIRRVAGRPLPDMAREIGVTSWPQFLLKWVISHPAVTVAIPATSNPDHMDENMALLTGPMPDTATRARMLAAFEA